MRRSEERRLQEGVGQPHRGPLIEVIGLLKIPLRHDVLHGNGIGKLYPEEPFKVAEYSIRKLFSYSAAVIKARGNGDQYKEIFSIPGGNRRVGLGGTPDVIGWVFRSCGLVKDGLKVSFPVFRQKEVMMLKTGYLFIEAQIDDECRGGEHPFMPIGWGVTPI